MNKLLMTAGAAALIAATLHADTHNVASGATETLNGVTETSRTVKSGAGTLVVTGDNAFSNGLQVTAGTLTFNGGTTTVTCSTSGTGTDTAPYSQSGVGTTVVVEGGANVTVSGSNYGVNWGGDLLVTNGVFDVGTIEFLNGFYVSQAGRLIVQDEGVFKSGKFRITQTGTQSLTDNVGLFLNAGGKMYVKELCIDGTGRYGVVRYNGGTLYKTTGGDLYVGGGNTGWDTVKSYVHEGGFHLVADSSVYMNIPLYSGTANDGGVHYSSSNGSWVYLTSGTYKNSTFNGGTWLDGNVALINYFEDAGLGAEPSSPTNNIFFSGNATLFGGGQNYTISTNRNIWIAAGSSATFGCNSEGTGLRIGGAISVPDGDGAAKDAQFNAGNSTWGGFVVFDPGEGRTNRLDRLHVPRNLEIASGVTIVRSPSKGLELNAPLYIEGVTNGYTFGYNSYGNLKVTGGKLIIEGNRYVEAHKYAQVVVEGGTVSGMDDGCEYLNGLSGTPATLTVGNGGVFEFYKVRVSQSGKGVPTDINVNTGGVLRTAYFYMDTTTAGGRINLNGGTIEVFSSSTVTEAEKNAFLGGVKSAEFWTNVTVRVLAGGARFNTAGYSRPVNMPLLSAVGEGETDGGLTKLGEGTLTMTTTNTYNGVTRVEGGTLAFSHANGRPDGDIEFSAAGLASCTNAPLLTAKALALRAGCGIRVTESDTLDAATWKGSWHTVATFEDDIAALPSITFVKADGTVASAENGWDGWMFRISADHKSLEFKRVHGTKINIR